MLSEKSALEERVKELLDIGAQRLLLGDGEDSGHGTSTCRKRAVRSMLRERS